VPGAVEEVVTALSTEVPERIANESAMSVGLKDALGPVGETVAASLTSPVKPLMLFTLMVDVPLVPAGMVRDAGLDDISKLGGAACKTVTERPTEWDDVPLVPLTTTRCVPGVALGSTLTVRIIVAGEGGKLTVVGFSVAVRPIGTLTVRFTFPDWPGTV
jgi:hypothetical protein